MKYVSLLLLGASAMILLGSCKKCYQCDTIGKVCSDSPYYNQVQTIQQPSSTTGGIYVLTVNNGSGFPSMYTCQ